MSVCSVSAQADANAQEEMRGLDEQVQEIKSDVLGIAAELSQLEERLLYPSNTQLAVFVSLADADKFRLDAVRIQIDGALAAHHIYSFKELEALQSGGVQRITPATTTGEHQIEVYVIGKLANGDDFKQTQQFTFNKDIKPRLLGVALASPASDKAAIQLPELVVMPRARYGLIGFAAALSLAALPWRRTTRSRISISARRCTTPSRGYYFEALQRARHGVGPALRAR
jgi:hypothetical protein